MTEKEARIDGADAPEIFWFHCQPNDTSERMTHLKRQVRWEGNRSAWDKLLRERDAQQDPIGLAGGIKLYQYAPNALGLIDPYGLIVYKIGSYTDSKYTIKGANKGLDAHYAGQKVVMKDLVEGYDPKQARQILYLKKAILYQKTLLVLFSCCKINPSTGKPFFNARELLARNIK
ncbi:hypothetical protein ACQ3G4_16775 [bacterium BS0013]